MPQNLFVAVLEMRGFVVGRANAPSGLHRYDGDGNWTHLGWRTTRCNGIAFDPFRPDIWFLGCGNGVFRTFDAGKTWRITTGWEISDVMDVTVDPHVPGRILAGSAYGIWRSDDGGDTWRSSGSGIPTPQASYIGVIEADRSRKGFVLAGGAGGLFRSNNSGDDWERVGPAVADVRDLRQSAADPACWLAATDGDGLLFTNDGGSTWRGLGGAAMKHIPFYSVALHPENPARMAAAGFRTGVLATLDGGRSWAPFGNDLPEPTVHGLVYETSGSLWAGTVGAGVFETDGPDASWRYSGLDGGTIVDMVISG